MSDPRVDSSRSPGEDDRPAAEARARAPRPARPKREVPAREVIEALEVFPGIHPSRIVVPATADEIAAAHAELAAQSHVGFDTESKPTFSRGQVSEGPHVLQFATLERAYIFQLHVPGAGDAVSDLLASTRLVKVGFGLDGDRTQIRARLGIEPQAVLDLDDVFRDLGFRRSVGLKVAVALVFKRRFAKSKRIGTSNWSHRSLSESQLLYAANDAYAAMRIHAAITRFPSIVAGGEAGSTAPGPAASAAKGAAKTTAKGARGQSIRPVAASAIPPR